MESLVAIILFAGLTSCSGGKTTENETESEHHHSEEIELTVKQMETVGIELGRVEMKNLNSVLRANGELVLAPQNKADVNSLVPGIIRQINVLEGVSVRRGQVLATLENLEIVKMQENYLSAYQDFMLSKSEYERQKGLSENNAGAGKNLEQASAKYQADRARFLSVEKQLEQLNINTENLKNGKIVTQIPVIAPISGVVGEIRIKTGSYVDMQTVLMDITDNSQLHCDLHIFEKDLSKVAAGQKVEIALTNQNGKTATGVVYSVNKSFEPNSSSVIVHVKIDKTADLIPGMYVTALINLGNQTVEAVPESAVANAEGKKFIFVVADEKEDEVHFSKTEVITGAAELGFVEIKPMETLPQNAKIITKGAFYVMSMIGDEAGHEH
ncbi:MAG: efflux RND transporter periplasmic adaptor subunit [Dysgonamonadaceae bacterium]|nr:efflux RND transporter periplasmic adaptor subunit [Dysgonamonadaceae bacterium]